MKSRIWKIGIVFGIIILFVGASVVPSISGDIDENKGIGTIMSASQTNDDSASSYKNVDWWPSFQHDLQNTGYSTSIAPESNSIEWTYPTGYIGKAPNYRNFLIYEWS